MPLIPRSREGLSNFGAKDNPQKQVRILLYSTKVFMKWGRSIANKDTEEGQNDTGETAANYLS